MPQPLPEHRLACHALMGMNRLFTRAFHTVRALSPCPLPRHGPAILICNHTSGLDPHLIQAACPRLITWMMAREYYDRPILRRMLDVVGVIPVTRGARDLAATRAALRALERGQVLGIFPEGGIEQTDRLEPFQPGVAMMALRSGAPVFPAYLEGTQRRRTMLNAFLTPQTACIAYGNAVLLENARHGAERLSAVTSALEKAVSELRHRVHKHCPARPLQKKRGVEAMKTLKLKAGSCRFD